MYSLLLLFSLFIFGLICVDLGAIAMVIFSLTKGLPLNAESNLFCYAVIVISTAIIWLYFKALGATRPKNVVYVKQI